MPAVSDKVQCPKTPTVVMADQLSQCGCAVLTALFKSKLRAVRPCTEAQRVKGGAPGLLHGDRGPGAVTNAIASGCVGNWIGNGKYWPQPLGPIIYTTAEYKLNIKVSMQLHLA